MQFHLSHPVQSRRASPGFTTARNGTQAETPDPGPVRCGPVYHVLLENGVHAADLDWQVDMARAKQACAGRMAIRGNLNPSAVLMLGMPDQEIGRCNPGSGAGGGLIVAPATPFENLHAMMRAASDRVAPDRRRE